MSAKKKAKSAKPQTQAANNGVDAELSKEALRNLTGFFDVLIQMDLAYKRKERKSDEDNFSAKTTAAPSSAAAPSSLRSNQARNSKSPQSQNSKRAKK